MEPQHMPGFLADYDYLSDHDSDIAHLATVTEEHIGNKHRAGDRDPPNADDDGHPIAKRQRIGYTCTACNMDFTEKRALARHKKTDHHRRQIGLPLDRKHACPVCMKKFTRGHDLKRHQNEQHPDVTPVTPITPTLTRDTSSGGSDCGTENASSQGTPRTSVSNASWTDGPVSISAASETLKITRQYPFVDSNVANHDSSYETTKPDRFVADSYGQPTPSTYLHPPSRRPLRQVPELGNVPELMETEHTDNSECSPESCRSMSSRGSDTLKTPEASLSPSAQERMAEMERTVPKFNPDEDGPQAPMCGLCGVAYEDDPEELVGHLKRHLDGSRGTFVCSECSIVFAREEDLESHRASAAKGHCGFAFPHALPCTGHHPPQSFDGGLSDYDRARLCNRLQHWEHAQLHAYISEVSELNQRRQNRKLSRWSDVIRDDLRRNSQSSFAISVKTYASAPCDGPVGKSDVGGLQKRMQQMSLGNTTTRIRRLVRTGSTHPQDTLNKSLRKAVKQGDLQKTLHCLDVGGDSTIVQEDQGPFLAVALWGNGHVASRMAEHRVDEDIMGSCSRCKVSSAVLNKPAFKVKALLRHGAGANEKGGLCGLPLVTAAWMGKAEIVKILLDNGADVDRVGIPKYGSALCAAAAHAGASTGHMAVVHLLLNRGADPWIRADDATPLMLARARLELCSAQAMGFQEPDGVSEARVADCQKVLEFLDKAASASSTPEFV